MRGRRCALRILLHACCGPCLLEPYDALCGQARVDVCYANPNIHPREEYERRRDTLLSYAADSGIHVIEVPYDQSLWAEAVAEAGEDRRARCRACYRLRIGLVASEAARGGYDAVGVLRQLAGLVDIYMPDMKFSAADTAAHLCQAADYPELNRLAIQEMHRQVGDLIIHDGVAVHEHHRFAGYRALLVERERTDCRHLLLLPLRWDEPEGRNLGG